MPPHFADRTDETLPLHVIGIGYFPAAVSSMTVIPGVAANSSRASSGVTGRFVSTVMLSLWQFATGIRTQVGQTSNESSLKIFRVSYTILSSSLV